MAEIDQLIIESQQQHQRYSELYGPNPASGMGFRDLSASARQLVEQINDIRDDIQALQFSTEVVPRYAHATAADHRPVSTTAHVTQVAAQTTDHSAQVIRDGLAAILSNSNSELNQISAVPDYDSPEGQAAILGIIGDHQARSAETVTNSAAAQQAAGAQAAASAGGLGATPAGAAAAAAMVPALASAMAVAPQAAAAMVPAAAALASAPMGALSAVRQPAGGPPGFAHTQPQPAPATQAGPAPTAGASPSAGHASPAPVGPSAPSAPPTPAHSGDGPERQHVQLAGFGTGQHPPQTPAPPDPPHGQDPRYWLDTKQILTLPPGQLPPAGYTQIGPGMYYPSTDPGYIALPPPPPAQLPVDMRDILHLPPGQLPPPGYQQMAPGTYFPVPHGADVPGPWPTPKQPIDVRDIIHLKPGELLPSPGYIEFAPGWYAPDVNSPFISGGPR